MDINKIIMDVLHETDVKTKDSVQESVEQELDNVSLETSLSETLLMTALPSAISAGIGAMSLRKTLTNTNTLNEMDWDEVAKKAGEHYDTAKNAVKTGARWLGTKAEEGYEKVKEFGKRAGRYIARGGGDSEEHKAKLAINRKIAERDADNEALRNKKLLAKHNELKMKRKQ